jgi:hypothetical protein
MYRIDRNEFLKKVGASYITLAEYLLAKMPINSTLLQHLSALDPVARGHTPALTFMKGLPSLVTNVVTSDEDLSAYQMEVRRFHRDESLPESNGTSVDQWWAPVFRSGKYPVLSRMVDSLLSCFHGPEVERGFSIMGNVITHQTASLNIKTFDAIQTIKYAQLAAGKSAVQFFHRADKLKDPVNPTLVKNMRGAHKAYHRELDEAREQTAAKRAKLDLISEAALSKRKTKELNMETAKKARKLHRRAQLTQLSRKCANKKKD